jgi:hypothetical protein
MGCFYLRLKELFQQCLMSLEDEDEVEETEGAREEAEQVGESQADQHNCDRNAHEGHENGSMES